MDPTLVAFPAIPMLVEKLQARDVLSVMFSTVRIGYPQRNRLRERETRSSDMKRLIKMIRIFQLMSLAMKSAAMVKTDSVIVGSVKTKKITSSTFE